MINSTNVVNGLPEILQGEERILERKDVRAEVWCSTKSYLEKGVLFLTTSRLLFVANEPNEMICFECLVKDVKDLSYSKTGDFRAFEAVVFAENYLKFCRFRFGLPQTGFRSLVSVLFSMKNQLTFNQ